MSNVYIHLEYPKVVYSIERPEGLTIANESDLLELEGDWYESPADFNGVSEENPKKKNK